jgi:hypothetical protein
MATQCNTKSRRARQRGGLHARLFSRVRQKAKGRERVLIQPVPKEIGVLRWNEAVM